MNQGSAGSAVQVFTTNLLTASSALHWAAFMPTHSQLCLALGCIHAYSQPALPCIGLHSCIFLKVLGVKGHMHT